MNPETIGIGGLVAALVTLVFWGGTGEGWPIRCSRRRFAFHVTPCLGCASDDDWHEHHGGTR